MIIIRKFKEVAAVLSQVFSPKKCYNARLMEGRALGGLCLGLEGNDLRSTTRLQEFCINRDCKYFSPMTYLEMKQYYSLLESFAKESLNLKSCCCEQEHAQ